MPPRRREGLGCPLRQLLAVRGGRAAAGMAVDQMQQIVGLPLIAEAKCQFRKRPGLQKRRRIFRQTGPVRTRQGDLFGVRQGFGAQPFGIVFQVGRHALIKV